MFCKLQNIDVMNIVGAAGPLEDGDMFPRDTGREGSIASF